MKNSIFRVTGACVFLLIAGVIVLSAPHAHASQQYYYAPYYPGVPTAGTSIGSQQAYIQQLIALIAQLQAQLNAGVYGGYDYRYTDRDHRDSGNSEVEVTTERATDIDDREARLRGSVDFNDSDFAYVWFEYGEDEDDLDDDTPQIRLDDNDDEDFSVRLTRLDEDERYYYRAIAEDDRGRIDRGSIRSFTTDDRGSSRDDDEPDVETGDADDIDRDSAEIEGDVDMNDFRNGKVFFVYGEDEDQVEDIEDDFDTFNDVDEDGDDLQKVLVDSDLDDERTYRRTIRGLDDDTEYFYSICVEFEDEDDDEKIICGGVEEFETD